MKKHYIILPFLCLSCFMPYIKAQTDSTKRSCFIIKTDLLNPAIYLIVYQPIDLPAGSLTTEVGFANRHSIQLSGLYGTYNHNWGIINLQQYKVNRIIIQAIADYKYYWKKKNNFKGFYSGVYFKFTDYNINSTGWGSPVYIHQKGFGGGGILGYQTYIKKHLVFDFLIGIGVLNAIAIPTIDMESIPVVARIPVSVPDLRASINVGYKF